MEQVASLYSPPTPCISYLLVSFTITPHPTTPVEFFSCFFFNGSKTSTETESFLQSPLISTTTKYPPPFPLHCVVGSVELYAKLATITFAGTRGTLAFSLADGDTRL